MTSAPQADRPRLGALAAWDDERRCSEELRGELAAATGLPVKADQLVYGDDSPAGCNYDAPLGDATITISVWLVTDVDWRAFAEASLDDEFTCDDEYDWCEVDYFDDHAIKRRAYFDSRAAYCTVYGADPARPTGAWMLSVELHPGGTDDVEALVGYCVTLEPVLQTLRTPLDGAPPPTSAIVPDSPEERLRALLAAVNDGGIAAISDRLSPALTEFARQDLAATPWDLESISCNEYSCVAVNATNAPFAIEVDAAGVITSVSYAGGG